MLQQVTKFTSSYSFGYLLRILLRAVNLFSFSHIVSSDSSFNIHNALYFVIYPSRTAQNSPEGRWRPAGRGLKTLAIDPCKLGDGSDQTIPQDLMDDIEIVVFRSMPSVG